MMFMVSFLVFVRFVVLARVKLRPRPGRHHEESAPIDRVRFPSSIGKATYAAQSTDPVDIRSVKPPASRHNAPRAMAKPEGARGDG
jgi:hypothetical protein